MAGRSQSLSSRASDSPRQLRGIAPPPELTPGSAGFTSVDMGSTGNTSQQNRDSARRVMPAEGPELAILGLLDDDLDGVVVDAAPRGRALRRDGARFEDDDEDSTVGRPLLKAAPASMQSLGELEYAGHFDLSYGALQDSPAGAAFAADATDSEPFAGHTDPHAPPRGDADTTPRSYIPGAVGQAPTLLVAAPMGRVAGARAGRLASADGRYSVASERDGPRTSTSGGGGGGAGAGAGVASIQGMSSSSGGGHAAREHRDQGSGRRALSTAARSRPSRRGGPSEPDRPAHSGGDFPVQLSRSQLMPAASARASAGHREQSVLGESSATTARGGSTTASRPLNGDGASVTARRGLLLGGSERVVTTTRPTGIFFRANSATPAYLFDEAARERLGLSSTTSAFFETGHNDADAVDRTTGAPDAQAGRLRRGRAERRTGYTGGRRRRRPRPAGGAGGGRRHTETPTGRRRRNLLPQTVRVFKQWLFEHWDHPYPSSEDKRILAESGGNGTSTAQVRHTGDPTSRCLGHVGVRTCTAPCSPLR